MKYFSLLFLAFASFSAFGFADLRDELFKKTSTGHMSIPYDEARYRLFNEIHLEKDQTGYFVTCVYCSRKVYSVVTRMPDPASMNTEHTWPQSRFTGRHQEAVQKSDLHHLYPTISRINSDRGNLPFAEVTPGKEVYCDTSSAGTEVNSRQGNFFEPPALHKGNVARALFYFSIRYQIAIDPVEEYYLRQWHILDPVDEREKRRHEIIVRIQKNRNPFIDEPALANQILDF